MDASGVCSRPWSALKAAGVRACRATADDVSSVAERMRSLERLSAKLFDLKARDAMLSSYSAALEAWSIWDEATEELLAVVGVGGELHLGDVIVPMAWCVGTPEFDAACARSPRKTLKAFHAMLRYLDERYGCVGNIMPNKKAFQAAARTLTACGAQWYDNKSCWVWLSNPKGATS